MTAPMLYTPSPDEVDCTQLAANLLGFAGLTHPTRAHAADVLELIAAALDTVRPDDEAMTQHAQELAAHFHAWAETVREVPADPDRSPFTARAVVGIDTHGLVPLQALDRLRFLAARAGKPQIKQVPEIKALRDAADRLPVERLKPIRLALTVEGGIVQGGALDSQLPIDLAIIDYDEKGEGARLVRQRDGRRACAHVYAPTLGRPEIDLDELFAVTGEDSSIAET